MHQSEREKFKELFYTVCKEHNLKVTPQRFAIYDYLLKSGKHPSAEALFKTIRRKFPNISFDTVNRTLHTFAEIGLVNIVEGFGKPRRYDPNLRNHHHVHCVRCGEIYDFYNKKYDELGIPNDVRRNFKILNKRVVLNGLCEKCQKQ